MTAKAVRAAEMDDMRMSASEFDRIMGKALQVKPKDGKPKKRKTKGKVTGRTKRR